jgi:hypothetical protein
MKTGKPFLPQKASIPEAVFTKEARPIILQTIQIFGQQGPLKGRLFNWPNLAPNDRKCIEQGGGFW